MAVRRELNHPSSLQAGGSGLLDQLAVMLSKQLKHQSAHQSKLPQMQTESGSDKSTTPKQAPPSLKPAAVLVESSDSEYSLSEPESLGTMESDDEADEMLGLADSGPALIPSPAESRESRRPEKAQVKAAKEVIRF
jgi:hypothetical protein